jgi:hypothetical protein
MSFDSTKQGQFHEKHRQVETQYLDLALLVYFSGLAG